MNILDRIVIDKQNEVNHRLKHINNASLKLKSDDQRTPLDFKAALQKKELSIIAEVKKASPSKGIIRPDFDPVATAISYEKHGASCISILTEENYFQGSTEHLIKIRHNVSLPILRKDFMVDPRQIRESYDLGADAILLIVSVLKDQRLQDFRQLALEFGMTPLVEVHSEEDLERALEVNCHLIGINNRDLKTFTTNIQHSIKIKKKIPDSVVTISESGIYTADDCRLLQQNGFDAVLVGESLMKKTDPGTGIPYLLGKD